MTAISPVDLTPTADPLELFADWLAAAQLSEPDNPTAFALATVGPDARPSVRMLLLKELNPTQGPTGGFHFYTNLESRKAAELTAHPHAAMCFYWKSLARQVRVEGPVVPLPAAVADAYFASRHRESQLSAWASQQSRQLASPADFERAVADVTARFAGQDVPRPPHWGGFTLQPERLEFWHEQPYRRHQRLVFTRPPATADWHVTWLYP